MPLLNWAGVKWVTQRIHNLDFFWTNWVTFPNENLGESNDLVPIPDYGVSGSFGV
jgi:hypothetical protein